MGRIGEAFELALTAHAGQTDKSGAPYIAHVVRVAAAVETEAQRVVALLHDVVEDTDVPLDRITEAFGPEIAAAVDAITKRRAEASEAYLARVRANPLALAVKHADLGDNTSPARLALLPEADRTRLTRKYADALARLTE